MKKKIRHVALVIGVSIGAALSAPGCESLPGANGQPIKAGSFDMFTKNNFKEKADQFHSQYNGVVDDLLTYQDNADYQKLEQKRENLVSSANALIQQLQEAAQGLQITLDRTAQQVDSSAPASQSNVPEFLSRSAIQQKADEFYSNYAAAVDDMLSYDSNPDPDKLEAKRQQLLSEADVLRTKLQSLANNLEAQKGSGASLASPDIAGLGPMDKASAEEKGAEFLSQYSKTIDDILSQQDNPDSQKADEKRQEAESQANSLSTKFRDLADKLQGALDRLRGTSKEK